MAGEVQFFVRPEAKDRQADTGRWLLAAQLCRRLAVTEQRMVQVCLPDAQALSAFDDWLWTFSPVSFVPHAIDDPAAPVNLVLTPDAPLVLNLHDVALIDCAAAQVVEAVAGTPAQRAQARLCYRAYQQAGWRVHTIRL